MMSLEKRVKVAVSYADGTSSRLKVPVSAMAAFINGLERNWARNPTSFRGGMNCVREAPNPHNSFHYLSEF
jgi:hypothetical protein